MPNVLKKLLFFILTCVMLIPNTVHAQAAESGINAVLVVDNSNSMNGTDPQRVAIEGTKLFIDMMENTGSTVGVIGFTGQLANVIPMTKINGQDDKNKIKSQVDSFTYAGETDMGLALTKAVQMIDQNGASENNVIIFLTDGKIDFFDYNNTRTIAQSEQEVNQALQTINRRYPIYTIGLNANGQVDQNIINKMASETGGEMSVVSSATELPKIYNNIFASFVQSDSTMIDIAPIGADGKSTTTFNVPNNSVLEANVMAFTDTPLTDIYASGPNGTVPQSVKTVSRKYTMLKIIRPDAGNWTVTVTGQPGCKVEATLLFNYNVEIDVSLEKSEYSIDEKIKVNATLVSDDEAIHDDALYGNIYAEAILIDAQGQRQSFPMEYKDETYSVEIPVEKSGNYSIEVKTNGDRFYRVTDPIPVTVSDAPVTTEQTEAQPAEKPSETAAEDTEDAKINPIVFIGGIAAVVILVVFGSKAYKRNKNKKRNLKGVLFFTNENGVETEISLSGCKGGSSLKNILKKNYYTEIETEFELKSIIFYYFFEKETGIEIVNRSPYKMRDMDSYSGEKKKIILKCEQGVQFVKPNPSGEDKIIRIRYEYL